MQKINADWSEATRVATLHQLSILDSPPEERFDRLTRLAKYMFNVPIALVSLVDEDRQWFKSKIGMAVSETARSISFCGHAILEGKAFVVSDALLDPRFSNNPLVLGPPHIRFYAGYPIRYSDGSPLGTLCVLDTQPRHLDHLDIAALKDLGELAEHEIVATHMAFEDELTHLPNRRGFLYQAQSSVNLCYRLKKPASLVFLDLRRFKQVNDTFGHDEGDYALKLFSRVLNRCARESDLIARLGGDEFVVFLPDASAQDAYLFTERLRESIASASAEAGRGYEIRFNEGMVELDLDLEHDIGALLKQADELMYKHKSKERLEP